MNQERRHNNGNFRIRKALFLFVNSFSVYNRLVLQPVPLRSLDSRTRCWVPAGSRPAPPRRCPLLPEEPAAYQRPRQLTRSSSARSSARRMRCPRQRPPSPAQAAHTGRRSEQQNHLRAWPCSGQSDPGSDPGPGPGPCPGPGHGPCPALSTDMAERPAPRAPPVAGGG